MVTRKRLRSILTALGLYVMAALLIGYFGVNAYSAATMVSRPSRISTGRSPRFRAELAGFRLNAGNGSAASRS